MKKCIAILIIIAALTGCGLINDASGAPLNTDTNPATQPTPSSYTQQQSTPPSQSEPPAPLAALTLIIPEGYTLLRIGRTLEDMGICTVEDFVSAARYGDFSDFPLVSAAKSNPNRFFSLEGYLFPGEYEIYPDETAESIIRRVLAETERMIDEDKRRTIYESGYSVDEILIIASIIQKESLGNDDFKPLVSSVIHNRLNIGMMLQMCMTSFYVRDYITPLLNGEDNPYMEHYNTYFARALPAGAICNPGLNAIHAALNPADTRYFFYIWDNDDNFHFAVTWEEHLANVRAYL